MNRTMRNTLDRRAPVAVILLTVSMLAVSTANATQARTWHLTNILEEHASTFGPGHAMFEGGGNGTFPTGHLAMLNASTFGSRVWSASPPAAGTAFGTRPWTLSFGGESVVTDLRFAVGSWDHRTGAFEQASGDPGVIGVDRAGTFTPASAFVVPPGRDLGLRVWVPRGGDTPSLLDVWDPVSGSSPSTLTLS